MKCILFLRLNLKITTKSIVSNKKCLIFQWTLEPVMYLSLICHISHRYASLFIIQEGIEVEQSQSNTLNCKDFCCEDEFCHFFPRKIWNKHIFCIEVEVADSMTGTKHYQTPEKQKVKHLALLKKIWLFWWTLTLNSNHLPKN